MRKLSINQVVVSGQVVNLACGQDGQWHGVIQAGDTYIPVHFGQHAHCIQGDMVVAAGSFASIKDRDAQGKVILRAHLCVDQVEPLRQDPPVSVAAVKSQRTPKTSGIPTDPAPVPPPRATPDPEMVAPEPVILPEETAVMTDQPFIAIGTTAEIPPSPRSERVPTEPAHSTIHSGRFNGPEKPY